MDYKLVNKAYQIDFNKIEEGYLASEVMCIADSRSKAKSKLLKKIKFDDWKHKYTGKYIDYLNIPVVRFPEADQYEFERKYLSKSEIDDIISERIRFKEFYKILLNPLIAYCYIKKHGAYYKPNACGYTSHVIEAGIYSKKEAIDHAFCCSDLNIIPIDVTKHNEIIYSKIEELKNKLIL